MKKEGANVQAYSVHPGIVNTDLFNGTNLKNVAPWIPRLLFKVSFPNKFCKNTLCFFPLFINDIVSVKYLLAISSYTVGRL